MKILITKTCKKILKDIVKVDDTIPFVKQYVTIIKIKKKCTVNIVYRQGVLFKRFKETGECMEKMKDIRVSRSTVYFKIKLVKIIYKYLKLKNLF